MNYTERLRNVVQDYHNWVAKHYSPEAIAADRVDTNGYPRFHRMEKLLAHMVQSRRLLDLDLEGQEHLLYLIGCQWHGRSIFNWISPNGPMYFDIKLSEEEFMFLARAVCVFKGLRIEDARRQIAASLHKLPQMTPELEELMVSLYENGEDYSRRLCLRAMGHFGHPALSATLRRSWEENTHQYHRLDVVRVMAKYSSDEVLRSEILPKARLEESKLIQDVLAENFSDL
jgi:hypothetical protein